MEIAIESVRNVKVRERFGSAAISDVIEDGSGYSQILE